MPNFAVYDRVKETSTTAGTGNITLAGTSTGFQTFSAVLSIGAQTFYAIVHRTANEWEVGIGTLSAATTLTRDSIYSSTNSNTTVNFSAGTKDVFITQPASKQLTPFTGDFQFLPANDETNTANRAISLNNVGGGTYGNPKLLLYTNLNPGSDTQSFAGLTSISSYGGSSSADLVVGSNSWSSGLRGVQTYLSTFGIPSPTNFSFLYKTSAGTNPGHYSSQSIEASTFVFFGYDTTPTFTDWNPFLPGTSAVLPGSVIVGDAATSPKFYRYNGSSWQSLGGGGVTQIVAGSNITISSTGPSGTGVVTINSTGGGGGGGWYSIEPFTSTAPAFSATVTLPSTWSAGYSGPADELWVIGENYSGWGGPSPGGPWTNSGMYPVLGQRYYLTTSFGAWSTAASPTSLNNPSSYDGFAVAFTRNVQADANTMFFSLTTGNNSFTSAYYYGGWPLVGSTRVGHAIIVSEGGDITMTATFPTGATKKDAKYDSYTNSSIFAVDYTSAALNDIASYSQPLIFFPSSRNASIFFWYTHT